FPAYEGYGQGVDGMYGHMSSNGVAKLQAHGAWLANRWLAYDNILWVHGGDNDPANPALTKALVNGINSVSTKWLHAWHGARNTSIYSFWANDLSWLTFNSLYDNDADSFGTAQNAYSNSAGPKPFARIEDVYENPVVGGVSTAIIRRLAWGSALQGGTGAIYGDVRVWAFQGPTLVGDSTPWATALERPGASTVKYLKQLYESKNWPLLVPDSSTRSFMTAGWIGDRFASLASGGSFGIIY